MVVVISTTNLNYVRGITEILTYRSRSDLITPILSASIGLEIVNAAKVILALHPDTVLGMFMKTFNDKLTTDFDPRLITDIDAFLPEFYANPHLTPSLDLQLKQSLNRVIYKIIEVLGTKTTRSLFVGDDSVFSEIYGQGEFDDPVFSAFGGVAKAMRIGDKLYVISISELAKALCDPVPYNPATGESLTYDQTITLKQGIELQLALARYHN